MASSGYQDEVNPLDNPKLRKAFFAHQSDFTTKNYRTETAKTTEVELEVTTEVEPEDTSKGDAEVISDGEAEDTYNAGQEASFEGEAEETSNVEPEITFKGEAEDAFNVEPEDTKVASPVPAATLKVAVFETGSIGVHPTTAALKTNGTKAPCDMLTFTSSEPEVPSNNAPANAGLDLSEFDFKTKAEKDAFIAYGLFDGSTKSKDALVEQNADNANLVNGDRDKKLSDEWIEKTHNTLMNPNAERFTSPKLNPEADSFSGHNPHGEKNLLDDPAHVKNFFRKAYESMLGSTYTPSSSRSVEKQADVDATVAEEASFDYSTPVPSDLKTTETVSSLTHGEHGTSDNYHGNSTLSKKHLESPYLSGVQAPPPTPESVGPTKNTIHIPATISEQDSEPVDGKDSQFSLSQSVHAPPHLRTAYQVKRMVVLPEKNASFERLSFKAATDTTTNGGLSDVSPIKIVVGLSGDSGLKESGMAKLPPHMRSRPENTGGSKYVTSKKRTEIPAAIDDSYNQKAKDNAGFGTLHATALSPTDKQRLMELGIYHPSSALQENVPPERTAASKDHGIKSTNTTYVPPHRRGDNPTVKISNLPKTNEVEPLQAVEAIKLGDFGQKENLTKMNGNAKEDKFTEDTVVFTRFPTPPPRKAGPARHRKVILKGLPEYATAAFASTIVWGGPLEDITLNASGTYAYVTFMHAKDCEQYFKDTSNDIMFTNNGKRYCVVVSKDADVTPESGLLKIAIERECTRSVRLVGVEKSYGLGGIWALASMKNRRVESVEDGMSPSGARQIVVNFCNVHDAIKFKSELNRDDEWEPINIHFKTDACAEAKSVRNFAPSATYIVKRPMVSVF